MDLLPWFFNVGLILYSDLPLVFPEFMSSAFLGLVFPPSGRTCEFSLPCITNACLLLLHSESYAARFSIRGSLASYSADMAGPTVL